MPEVYRSIWQRPVCLKDSPRRALAIVTACIYVGDPCCVSFNSPSLLCLFVDLFLHLLSSQDVKSTFVPCFPCFTQNHLVRYTLPFLNLPASHSCISLCLVGSFLHQTALHHFTLTLKYFHFIPLCWAFSDAALTPAKLCPIVEMKKTIFRFSPCSNPFSSSSHVSILPCPAFIFFSSEDLFGEISAPLPPLPLFYPLFFLRLFRCSSRLCFLLFFLLLHFAFFLVPSSRHLYLWRFVSTTIFLLLFFTTFFFLF